MIKILVLLGILSLSLSQNIPPCIIACQTLGSTVGCPSGSVCRNINPDGTVPRLVCVCNNIASANCSSNGGFVCSSGNSTTNTGCGERFPNGCPRDASCVFLSTTNQRTCVCNTPGAYLDPINNVCVPPCPLYSARNQNGVCECVAPYVRDTSVNELRCILSSGATCNNINCPLNYHCEVPSNGGPVCVPDRNSQVCGVDFRCPSPLLCVDTSLGPKCICPRGFAGPSCAYRECYTLTGTNELGCWAFNETANCTLSTSATETPYCRCKDNLIPPDCTPSDGPCANVDCSAIPNSRCYNGRCICREGYVAVPSTTNPNTYTCRPVGSCNCTGNRVCSSNGGCVCPADTLGGADCSRPACSTDSDCTAAGLLNAYCVTNTNTGVRGFCVCSPGYSGERCDTVTNNCDRNTCRLPYRVCNNENRCVCAPEFNGTNCTRPVPPSCVSIRIIVRASSNQVTAEQLTSILASFIGIDQSLINVTGPFPLPGNNTAVVYNVRICRDSSTNEQSASDDFVDDVNNGGASSFGIQSAAVGEYTGESSSSNGSAVIAFSVLLLCITAMFV